MNAKQKSLANQNRGGIANKQGGAFEDNFAVWRCMEALRQFELGAEKRQLASQLKNAPVDDWVEKRNGGQHHYQLKRAKKLSWSAVAADFKQQLKTAVSATLVVRTAATLKTLSRSRKRVAGATLLHFPGAIRPAQVMKSALVSQALKSICIKAKPTASDLDLIWAVIDLAWKNTQKLGRFIRIDQVEKELSDLNAPIRIRWRAPAGWMKARKLLSSIAGLSFHIDGGHFFFDDGAGFRGHASCKNPNFVAFVRAVGDGKITTAYDVGAHL